MLNYYLESVVNFDMSSQMRDRQRLLRRFNLLCATWGKLGLREAGLLNHGVGMGTVVAARVGTMDVGVGYLNLSWGLRAE